MFVYGRPAGQPSDRPSPASTSVGPVFPTVGMAFDAVTRRKTTVLACVLLGATAGWAATKAITPRYVATTQIYIDPGNIPGAEKDALAPGQDSTGFINYVESQGLIITSRQVLQTVVRSEKLDVDPEFVGPSRPSFFSTKPPNEADLSDIAVSALGARLQTRRPERTFVIDLSASDKDPDKAARLANATAQAYIQVLASMQKDAAGRAEASLSDRLVALRARVIDAENAVEAYKSENGLVGTRDQLVSEQQLKELTTQMSDARAKADDARAQLDQIEASKRGNAGNVAALASQLNSAALAALRTQQATAHQQLANLEGELGPRHPQVIDAKARASTADRAVEAELDRIAQSQRVEYQRAKQLEWTLGKQLDGMKSESVTSGERSVGLRDLERRAEAARGVYELFVTRSRETGDIQQIEPSRTHVISEATAPTRRAFPPGTVAMASAGALVGALLGLLAALARQGLLPIPARGRGSIPDSAVPATPSARSPRDFLISRRTLLESSRWPQNADRLDLTGLGVPAVATAADCAEFDAILDALPEFVDGDGRRPVLVAVLGSNHAYARISLSLNLALAAAAQGARVALFDAAERDAPLTRSVGRPSRAARIDGIATYRTVQDILLAIPKASDPNGTRYRPTDMLDRFAAERINLIICDAPKLDPFKEEGLLDRIDRVLVVDDAGHPNVRDAVMASLENLGLADRAYPVRFNPTLREERKRA